MTINIVYSKNGYWGTDVRDVATVAESKVANMTGGASVEVATAHEALALEVAATRNDIDVEYGEKHDNYVLALSRNDFWRIFQQTFRNLEIMRTDVEKGG